MFKTKGLLITKVYFLKLDELVEKPLAKCAACQIVRKKHPHPTLEQTQKNPWIPLTLISSEHHKFHQLPTF